MPTRPAPTRFSFQIPGVPACFSVVEFSVTESNRLLVDTGPLVAFLNKRDRFHDWTAAQWNQIAAPMLTCEAVVSETCFLLSEIKSGSNRVMQLIQRKILKISFHLEEHIDPVNKLLIKYQSGPMSLADACLVRMSELHSNSSVFTLDSDFNLYRKNGRQVIPSIMPG